MKWRNIQKCFMPKLELDCATQFNAHGMIANCTNLLLKIFRTQPTRTLQVRRVGQQPAQHQIEWSVHLPPKKMLVGVGLQQTRIFSPARVMMRPTCATTAAHAQASWCPLKVGVGVGVERGVGVGGLDSGSCCLASASTRGFRFAGARRRPGCGAAGCLAATSGAVQWQVKHSLSIGLS